MNASSRASSLRKKLVVDSWSRNRKKGSQTPTRWMLMERLLVEALCLLCPPHHLLSTLLGIGPLTQLHPGTRCWDITESTQ